MSRDLSKNREATGSRSDPLLRWYAESRHTGHRIDAVEYQRRSGHIPPYFNITAIIRLVPVYDGHPLSRSRIQVAHQNLLLAEPTVQTFYATLIAQFPSIPVFAVSYRVPGPMKRFFVTDLRHQTESDLSDEEYSRLIGQGSHWQSIGDRTFSDYSMWHRAHFRSSAYLHDIDLVLTSPAFAEFQWIEVTQAQNLPLDYTVFSFLSRSFAQVGLYLQLAQPHHSTASLVVHNHDQHIVQCSFSAQQTQLMPWIDQMARQRQAIVQQTAGSYHSRMGQAARQLFEAHGHDVEFLTLWEHRQCFSSYGSWAQTVDRGSSEITD